MPRSFQITAPTRSTPAIMDRIGSTRGVLNAGVQKNENGRDSISVTLLDRWEGEFLLNIEEFIRDEEVFTVISEPSGVITSKYADETANDTSESSWEEMEFAIAKESNATLNAMLLTFTAGLIATIGIAENSLHTVIAAMLITPGFMPFVRIGLGIVSRSKAAKRGVISFLKLYGSFLLGAMAATALILNLGYTWVGEESSYIHGFALLSYWQTVSVKSVMISSAASVAGVILVLSRRSVLTAGVMIALALVPSAAMFGIGIAVLDLNLIARGLGRFALEAGLVLLFSTIILFYKKLRVHKRDMVL